MANLSSKTGFTPSQTRVSLSEWQSYTPNIAGRTTNPTQGTGTTKAYWRRVGSNAEVQFSFTQTGIGSNGSGDYLFPLPSSLTINSSVLANTASASGFNVIGSAQVYSGAVGAIYEGVAQADGNNIILVVGTNGASTGNVGSGFLGFGANATMRYSFTATIPIAEWAGSGTVNLGAGAQVEYASNSGAAGTTANTQYTTGSVAGSAGSAFVATASTTVTGGESTDYAVDFQYPIQSDDILSIEILWPGNNEWVPLDVPGGVVCPLTRLSNGLYGMGIVPRSSTSVFVRFGNGGRLPTGGYGSAGSTWAGLTSYKWRVRKAKASSPVGFGVASPANGFGLVAPRKGQQALTVTSSVAFTGYRAVGIYYQDQDGNHRLKFNIVGTVAGGSRTGTTLTITGVTFKNATSYFQAVTGVTDAVATTANVNPNAATLAIVHTAATTAVYGASGDVELESKPTWA